MNDRKLPVTTPRSATSSRVPKLGEAIFLGILLGTLALVLEITVVACLRDNHLVALRHGDSVLRLWSIYAAVYVAASLCGWLVALLLPFPRRSIERDRALILAGAFLPGAISPYLVPLAGFRLLSRDPLWFWGGVVAIPVVLFIAALSSRSRRFGRFVPFGIGAAVLLLNGYLVRHTLAVADLRSGFAPLAVSLVGPLFLAMLIPLMLINRGGRVLALIVVAALFIPMFLIPRSTPNESDVAARAGDPRPSILLVVADTLRADHVAGLGGDPADTPHLAELAADGVFFGRGRSAAPWTLPSFGSLFTSTYPSNHGAGARFADQPPGSFTVREDLTTLAEVLWEAGYWTASRTTNTWVAGKGLDQGFDSYRNSLVVEAHHLVSAWVMLRVWGAMDSYITAELQTELALDAVDEAGSRGAPFFLVAHYMDPHLPYLAPSPFYREGESTTRLIDRYRAEVRRVDESLGRLLSGLKERGIYDDLCIVFTSDHGEELHEKRIARKGLGRIGLHGHTLYEELLHVPLIVKLPGGVQAGTVRPEPVSLIDLAPSIAKLARVEVPSEWVGWDLFSPSHSPSEFARRTLLAEGIMDGGEQKAALRGVRKVLVEELPPDEGAALVFDLSRDPGERVPGPLARPVTRAMFETLRAFVEQFADQSSTGGPLEIDAARRQQLEALGYVGDDE
jgi:arylsulfatase A-like enzyme